MINTRAGAILREAADIVDGAEAAGRGNKERSFDAIARLWSAYLNARWLPLTAADVAAMMVLLKLARADHGKYHPDHAIDAAGYAAIWGEMREASQ